MKMEAGLGEGGKGGNQNIIAAKLWLDERPVTHVFQDIRAWMTFSYWEKSRTTDSVYESDHLSAGYYCVTGDKTMHFVNLFKRKNVFLPLHLCVISRCGHSCWFVGAQWKRSVFLCGAVIGVWGALTEGRGDVIDRVSLDWGQRSKQKSEWPLCSGNHLSVTQLWYCGWQ